MTMIRKADTGQYRLIGRLLCWIGDHDWTCAIEEGQDKPTQAQIDAGVEGFYDYAKMYCKRKHCRKISELSLGPH